MEKLAERLKQYVLDTFRKGGEGQTISGRQASTHPWTGGFENSLEAEIIKDKNTTTINIWGNSYGEYLNRGVRKENIKSPFAPNKIKELQKWVKGKLGIGDEKTSLSVTYAIAQTHKKHGYPIRNNNPPGTWWLEGTQEDQEIFDKLTDDYWGEIQKEISKIWQSQ